MKNNFPIFIPTKGRYDSALTIKAFDRIGVDYQIVIEKQEYKQYLQVVDKNKIIVLPHQNEGLKTTRNWIWDYVENELKTPYFWTFDDNIRGFSRLQNNIKYPIKSPTFLKIIEDFAQRYENLIITGMQYEMFVPRKTKQAPLIFNTRVYSNMLLKTFSGYRNNLFFNDDTDLNLQVLKDGNCTCQFVAFLADKICTMIIKGGMEEYYKDSNQRLKGTKELQLAHPDVTKIVWKFGRWHHHVDYSKFRNNKLIKKPNLNIKSGTDNYGMVLKGDENDNH